mgnify:CR=1 FL=1
MAKTLPNTKNEESPKAEAKEEKKVKTSSGDSDTTLLYELKDNYQGSVDARTEVDSTWDDKEKMFYGKIASQKSIDENRSQVSDPRISSIAMERAARVMAQNPSGTSQAISMNDKGKNALMDMIIEKYVIPNANSQFPLLVKERLLDLYSQIYGVSFALVDRVYKKNYVGPDMWVLPIRMCYPEPGALSLEESYRFDVGMMKDLNWFESLPQTEGGWKNIDKVIEKLKAGQGTERTDLPSEQRSWRERSEGSQARSDKNNNKGFVVTEYRKDRWITFMPDLDLIIRDIDNPHDDDELPIKAKYCFPTMDSIWGLGEFERGETLQKAIDSLINLYLDGVKMSIFPPMIVDPKGVVASSMKMGAGERWIRRGSGQIPVPVPLSPQGLNTFQSTYSFLVGSLLNLAGTTDTAITADFDPGFGRTPQALRMQAARENTRDNWDRFMMEQTLEEIFKKFVRIVAKDASTHENLTVRLFGKEIEAIKKRYPDVEDLLETSETGRMAEVKVDGKEIEGIEFDYQIVPGSTMKVSELEQNQALTSMIELYVKNKQVLDEQFAQEGKEFKLSEAYQQWIATSGVQDYDKIIVPAKPLDQATATAEDKAQQTQDLAAAMGGQMPPEQMPPQMMPGMDGTQAPPQMPQVMNQQPPQMMPQQPMPQEMPVPQAPDLGPLPKIAEQMFGGIPYEGQ